MNMRELPHIHFIKFSINMIAITGAIIRQSQLIAQTLLFSINSVTLLQNPFFLVPSLVWCLYAALLTE